MSTLWDTFADPPRAFSPVPLWWWSGDTVTAERLRWQLERLAAGGVFNVVVMNVAPTSPLYGKDADDPPFMSEPWWKLFEGVCADAGQLGVRLWFYDQIGFSGANFQGQVVRAHPEHAGRWIERVEQERGCPAGGTPVATADGWLYYEVQRGFDYFSAPASARLFALVHGRFEERVGHLFGSVIAGSFQDELPNLPTWGPDFADRFEAITGYDPLPRLAALWEDGGHAGERFRADYHAVRGRLAEEAFFRPLHEWHERHGLLCGVDQQYGGRDGQPGASSELYGDYARTHRWFSAPGSDHHGDAKIHSSLAHHYGRPRAWIEAFHTSGWGGTLEETFDWLLPWIGAGANLYNPHATYYSTRAGWWEWAPPATDWRQPYWRHYGEFARAIGRLCAMLTWGHHSCDVGVLFPSATARAALRLDGLTVPGRRADALYREIVGSMVWHDQRPGVLNRLTRDFDVLDDDTVAGGSAHDGALHTAHESYAAIVLPACEVLEGTTAARLTEFVDAGGTLIAVGSMPARAAGMAGDDAVVTELAGRFESGTAHRVDTPDELGAILEAVPRQVRAPMPTLLRRDGETGVLFVPAVYPRASHVQTGEPGDHFAWLRGVTIDFDRSRHAEAVDVVVAGISGTPQLWEPFSGARRRVDSEPTDDGLRVRMPFTDGPCALLVWGVEADPEAPPRSRPAQEIPLDGEWDVLVETTLADDWGDLGAPEPGVVETWELEQLAGGEWTPIHATFGTRAMWRRADAEWRPASWSSARGIRKDPTHAGFLGPSGRVPEEFLDFGVLATGESVDVRALVHCPAPLHTHLALGASAAKQAWLDGRAVDLTGGGYHATGPVQLPAGETLLELRLTATEPAAPVRAHFAFVADIDGYARPEWLRTALASRKSSVVTFASRVRLAAAATSANVLVGANGPCRVLIDGEEVGRQGGFDPYAEHDRDRLQPYELAPHLGAGEHELRLELLDLGRTRPVALLDGLALTPAGTVPLRSDERWTACVDGRPAVLDIRLDQRGDPAYSHAWRRPHPLPGGAWLEPGRRTADAGGPLTIAADTTSAEQRLRVAVPPGARSMRMPLADGCHARVGAHAAVQRDGELVVTLDGGRPGHCEVTVEGAPGLSGGALLTGPVAFTVGPGRMDLVDWQDAGLANHSGAVRYRRHVSAPPPGTRVALDLGDVRGTAEVLIDGERAGVRVCSPFVFELGDRLGPRGADLEIVVLNTLAPHFDAVGPTPYVFAGQRRSGLFGPVRLMIG
jgi:hypothetical protein